MKLLKLTATFGKLQQETLSLQDGLNVLQAPNEWGKSTWSAFLLAMFYGISTSERMTKNNLPDKEKYKPWSGSPMSGRMELEWNGRYLTIERTSANRVPMGQFAAYETDSGLPCPELTGENCGKMLLGVERSVFARSALIGQNALAVGKDADLERRLTALTATGEETVSYTETGKRLRDWKNHCRYRQKGKLPEAEAALEDVTAQLSEIHRLNQESQHLRAQEQLLSQQQAQLQTQAQELELRRQLQAVEDAIAATSQLSQAIARQTELAQQLLALQNEAELQLQGLSAEEHNKQVQRYDAAQRQYEEAAAQFAALTAQTAAYPTPAALHALQQQDLQLQAEISAAAAQTQEPQPEPPQLPPVLSGKTAEELQKQAAQAAAELELLTAPVKKPKGLWIAACALLCAGAVSVFLLPPLGIFLLLGAGVAAAIGISKNRQQQTQARANTERAQALLQSWGAATRDEILTRAADAAAALLAWQQTCTRVDRENTARQARMAALEAKRSALYGQIHAFAGDGVPEQLLQNALSTHLKREEAERNTALLLQTAQALAQAAGDGVLLPLPENYHPGPGSKDTIQQQLEQVRKKREAVLQDLNRLQGQASSAEPPEQLEARRAQLFAACPETACKETPDAVQAARLNVQQQLESVRRQLSEHRGLVSGKGDPVALGAKKEALQREILQLQGQFDALSLAETALEDANNRMQSRFAPQLSQAAAERMARLTDGRYRRVLMDRELTFRAQEPDAPEAHAVSYLSCGTADQLYLSVRLSLCSLMLAQDTPLILDDALVNFDDSRAESALLLLQEESDHRQILLFTCHSRETELLKKIKLQKENT